MIVVEERNGRYLVFLTHGTSSTRLGGFTTRRQADHYAAQIAAANPDTVDAARDRALATAIYQANIAAQNVRKWTDERNKAIRAALAAGASQRTVAEATGLTHPAVAKIGKRST